MSEQELKQDPAPHHPRRRRFKRKWGIGAGAIALVAVIAGGVTLYAQAREERAKILRASPDSIPDNAELLSYALPRGKAAYAEHCAVCHGANMKGDPLKGIPNLTDNDFLYGSGRVSEIEQTILYGIRSGNSKGWDLASMPAFGTANPYPRYKVVSLSPQELDDITSYIYAFQHPPKTVAEKESIARGGIIFRGYIKGVCWDCHANDAKGDTAIGAPDLADNIWLYGDGSRQWIHHTITFGLEGYCPAWINRLSFVAIRSIAVYLHSILKKPDVKTANAGGTS